MTTRTGSTLIDYYLLFHRDDDDDDGSNNQQQPAAAVRYDIIHSQLGKTIRTIGYTQGWAVTEIRHTRRVHLYLRDT